MKNCTQKFCKNAPRTFLRIVGVAGLLIIGALSAAHASTGEVEISSIDPFASNFSLNKNKNESLTSIPSLEQLESLRVGSPNSWWGGFAPNGMAVLGYGLGGVHAATTSEGSFSFEEIYNLLIPHLKRERGNRESISIDLYAGSSGGRFYLEDVDTMRKLMYGLRDKIRDEKEWDWWLEEYLSKYPLVLGDDTEGNEIPTTEKQTSLREKLESIVVSEVNFRQARLDDVLNFFDDVLRAHGFHVILVIIADEDHAVVNETYITMWIRHATLWNVLNAIAEISGLRIEICKREARMDNWLD